MLYQNQQRNGRHKSTCRLWSNRLLHERKLHTTNETGKKTSAETSKNMEHRQHCESSRGNHTLHRARHTNGQRSTTNTIPHHQHRKRRHHTGLSMDGGLRTSILMEEWSH